VNSERATSVVAMAVWRRRRGVAVMAALVLLSLTRVEFFRAPFFVDDEQEKDETADLRKTWERALKSAHPNRTVQVVVIDGVDAMNQFLVGSFYGNPFCEAMDRFRSEDPAVVVAFHFTFGCQDLFDHAMCGTGNFLGLLYGMRLTTEVYGDVELHFTCHDAEATKERLILPWLTGVVPARPADQPSVFPDLTPEMACGGVYVQPVGHMVRVIQQDLRRMAVALVGRSPPAFDQTQKPGFLPQLPDTMRPNPAAASPPWANLELDEAVLHFRCGDLMDSDHWSFAFMNFHGYVRHIAPQTRSIGILTQPFANDAPQVRFFDSFEHTRDRCRTVVVSLVDYIQERFPQAKISIHNNDSIALSYARMILAQQAIVGISTFGVMPAVATFGTGYIRIPDDPGEVNQWLLLPRIDAMVDNVVFIEDTKVPVKYIQALWQQEGEAGVLAWFWNDTWTAEE
jgi:hypothetical protein